MGEWLCLLQNRPRRQQTRRGSVCGSDRLGDFDCDWSGRIGWIPVKSNLITLIQMPPIHKCTSPLLNEDVAPTCPLFEEQLMFRHGIRIPNCYRNPSILDLFNAFCIPECENMSICDVRRQQEPRQFPNITFLDYLSRVRVWAEGKGRRWRCTAGGRKKQLLSAGRREELSTEREKSVEI
ncbi:hypothetical protein FH972_026809 [Carpinus fangiana]|uniref:Uncharacterized protein n=1 Tax=Carpinus fangiana TaxID=176857 RepID=A0A5N6L543_9ROSI|nr:hypothetical protein FH972_026809 [Carpinus fangiana]